MKTRVLLTLLVLAIALFALLGVGARVVKAVARQPRRLAGLLLRERRGEAATASGARL